MIDWTKFKEFLTAQIGKPYKYGVENMPGDINAKEWDCSELVEMAYAYVGVIVPDGSQNQYEASSPIVVPKLGDVGFARKQNQPCHHSNIIYDDMRVIEARGDNYQQVILRPKAKWEAHPEFTGWRRFKV